MRQLRTFSSSAAMYKSACRIKPCGGKIGILERRSQGARPRCWAILSRGWGVGLGWLAFGAVPVQLAQVVRCAGEQPFAFACGETAPGHHGQLLARLQLPEHWFHGAGPAS